MSIWTHVTGVVRIDGHPMLFPKAKMERLKTILGPISTFDEPDDRCTIPAGSEGSLRYALIEYGSGMPWVVLVIWGDLRDFDDASKVFMWMFDKIKEIDLPIRDGVLQIEVEGKQPIIARCSGGPEWIVEKELVNRSREKEGGASI